MAKGQINLTTAILPLSTEFLMTLIFLLYGQIAVLMENDHIIELAIFKHWGHKHFSLVWTFICNTGICL